MAYNPNNANGQAVMAASAPVVIASNQTSIPVAATLEAETTKVIGTVNIAAGQTIGITANSSVNNAQINGVTPLMGNGTTGTGSQRVTIASDNTPFAVKTDQTTHGTTDLVAADNVKINGEALLAGNGTTGTGSQRVTIASDNTPFAVKTDQTTHGTTDLVAADVTKIGGTAIVTGGTNGSQAIGGIQAHDAADSGNNPVKIGARAVSSEPTAVSTGDIANMLTDLVGKLIVLPYANPENFVSGAITTAMTGTTSTSLVAAPAAGLRNYITTIIVSNAHATVGTDVVIQDGSGGTTLMTIPAAAVYGGAVINLPVPLRQPTTATAIYCANVTTGASVKVSAVGYKGI